MLKRTIIVVILVSILFIGIYLSGLLDNFSGNVGGKNATQTDSIHKRVEKETQPKEEINLAGHEYLTADDEIIYALKFLDSNEVIVYIYNEGIFQQPYTIQNGIIDIKLWKTPLRYKILNDYPFAI